VLPKASVAASPQALVHSQHAPTIVAAGGTANPQAQQQQQPQQPQQGMDYDALFDGLF
jgi:hypothetical protein